jgi:hypothetical protein
MTPFRSVTLFVHDLNRPRAEGKRRGRGRASHNADQNGGSIMRSAGSELSFKQLLILGLFIGEQLQKPFMPGLIDHDGGFGRR